MKKETIKRIFEFLKEKEGKKHKYQDTLRWKLIFNEPLTEKELDIKGSLFLEHSSITYLPKGLKVSGHLNLSYTFKLKSLPNDLDVKGDIYLEGSKITSLPEGLKVGGHLDLFESDIEFLPKGLEVGENLDISNTELTKYTDKELRDMIKPGIIRGFIYRL